MPNLLKLPLMGARGDSLRSRRLFSSRRLCGENNSPWAAWLFYVSLSVLMGWWVIIGTRAVGTLF